MAQRFTILEDKVDGLAYYVIKHTKISIEKK